LRYRPPALASHADADYDPIGAAAERLQDA
jgi:hypothetical protein